MFRHRLPTLATAATALATAVPAAAHAAATPIASEPRGTTVTTYGDAIAWSSYDATTKRYTLKLDRAGTIAPATARSSAKPFDADLGTSTQGAPVAVYSRNGALYEYSLTSGKEKKLDVAVSGRRLGDPTVLAGRLAFVGHRSGQTDVLYLRTGTRGAAKAVYSAPAIRDPELSGTRLAFVTLDNRIQESRVQTLRLQTLSGTSRAIYTARSGGLNQADILAPSFDTAGKRLYWVRRNMGSGTGNRYIRRTIATGRTTYASGSARTHSASWVDDASGFATVRIGNDDDVTAPGGPVTVSTTGPLSFTAQP